MMYFQNNWRLSKEKFTKSIFKLNCNYNEHTPVELVQSFIKNKQGVSLKNNRILKGKYDNEETQMQEYMKNFDKKTNTFKVKYIIPAHRWGRINPNKSLSLCVFHRPTRHAYCKGVYIDIDMKNAHPVIIKNLCKMNNIPCPNITLYCNDRDEFLGKICVHHGVDKETAKRLILRLTYGGEYNRWLSEIELKQQSIKTPLQEVLDYEAEMTTVRDIVFQHNSHIISDVEKADPLCFKNPKYKTPEDILRKKKKTCMSHFCCTIERHLQEACIKHLVENKGFVLNDIVPCQDGFMILENLYYENILDECQEVIKNTLGFDIELKVKDFDEACDIPVNTSHEVGIEVDGNEVLDINWDLSEAEFAKGLKKYCFDNKPILFTGKGKEPEGYLFNGVYWTELSLHNAEIQKKHFDNLYKFYWENIWKLFGKKEKPSESDNRLIGLIRSLNTNKTRQNIVKIFKYENYVENVKWNTHTNYVIFDDCIYDLNIGNFITPDPLDYENLSCGYNYNIEIPPAELHAVKDDIISIIKNIVDPNNFHYFMKHISTFLIQNNFEEKAYFWLGKGRNGKGTITTLLKRVLNNYWGELNVEYYTTKKQRADEPNQNLFNCKYSRVLNTSEVAKDEKTNAKVRFNNDAFTRITGNDIINARELGTKTVAVFRAGKILIQLNDMCEFSKDINHDDISLRERIVIINMPYSFTSDQFKIYAEPHVYKPIDITIKRKFESDIYRRAMLDIMLDYFKVYLEEGLEIPKSVKDFTDSYFGTQSILCWFNNTYERRVGARVGLDVIQADYKNEFDITISKCNLREKLEREKLGVVKVKGYFYVEGYMKVVQESTITEGDADAGFYNSDIKFIEL